MDRGCWSGKGKEVEVSDKVEQLEMRGGACEIAIGAVL
jgi:hypothetical protein